MLIRSFGYGAAFALTMLAGRAGAQDVRVSKAAPPQPSSTLSIADVRRLHWIAGDWRGIGTGGTVQSPFHERYAFPDDSTLVVYTFTDSTRRVMSDSSRYELRAGRFAKTGTRSQYAAVRIDAVTAVFVPVARASNAFAWHRVTPDEWTATIEFRNPDGSPARRMYAMTRVRP